MVKLQERLDQTYSALSDQTRRAMLRKLRNGSKSVNELAKPFGISLAAVSKHLKVLENARLVNRKRVGRKFIISLAPKPLSEATKWLDHYREFWDSNLDRLSEYVNKQTKGDSL